MAENQLIAMGVPFVERIEEHNEMLLSMMAHVLDDTTCIVYKAKVNNILTDLYRKDNIIANTNRQLHRVNEELEVAKAEAEDSRMEADASTVFLSEKEDECLALQEALNQTVMKQYVALGNAVMNFVTSRAPKSCRKQQVKRHLLVMNWQNEELVEKHFDQLFEFYATGKIDYIGGDENALKFVGPDWLLRQARILFGQIDPDDEDELEDCKMDHLEYMYPQPFDPSRMWMVISIFNDDHFMSY